MSGLRIITMTHWGLDGAVHTGRLFGLRIVRFDVARRVRVSEGLLPVPEGTAGRCAFSPDGQLLAVGYLGNDEASSGVVLWDVRRNARLQTQPLPVREGFVERMAFSPDGQALAVSYDGSVAARGVSVYIDGHPAKLTVLIDTLYRPFRNAGKQFKEPFRIGAGYGADCRFQGEIDDLRVYDRVLKPEEIAAMAVRSTVAEISAKPAGQRSDVARHGESEALHGR